MVHATFVMEQHLGHQTYYQNMRRFVEPAGEVADTWVPVTYTAPNSLWERLPFLSAHLRGTLCGRAAIRRALRASESDVTFFNTQVPAVLGGDLTGRRPYLIATDITPIQYDRMAAQYGHQPDGAGPLKTYKHLMNVATLRQAACLLPWSNWTRNSLIRDYGVDPERITVLPPGVDLERWSPAHGQHTGPLRILFVGGDLERKGGDKLLAAFRALPPGTAELILVTRSQVPHEAGVQVYNDLKPNSPELIELYRTADVFVLPTAGEAFGIAAVEAGAAGLPALVTGVGGLTDIVVDGETGFLIPAGDQAALVERLKLLAADPARRERMGRAARQRAEQHFSTRRNARRLVGCLLAAVERNSAVPRAA